MDAFLSYFCRERWSLLDYFDPADTFVFFDELSRSAERGRQTELEFSESMKQRLEMGYILPGQMNELFGYKEIMGRLEKYSCCAVSARIQDLRIKSQLGSRHSCKERKRIQ